MRSETRARTITCEANSEEEADIIFDKMLSDSCEIDFDDMECIDAEDYVQDVELA